MRTILIFILISLFSSINIYAERYAILISAGHTLVDNAGNNSEYWYDLFNVYKELIVDYGYKPENVFVFYGDGKDFDSKNELFKPSTFGLNSPITDFDNSVITLNNQFRILSKKISKNDNLLIRWIAGHGQSSGDSDDYSVLIENAEGGEKDEKLNKKEIVDLIDIIKHYSRRKIIWMTCHSGCLAKGEVTFNKKNTVLLTSSDANEKSFSTTDNIVHSELNYVMWNLPKQLEASTTNHFIDKNNDGLLNFREIYNGISMNKQIGSCPQILDESKLAHKIYLEEYLDLSYKKLSKEHYYIAEEIEVAGLEILHNAKVYIMSDTELNNLHSIIKPNNAILEVKSP